MTDAQLILPFDFILDQEKSHEKEWEMTVESLPFFDKAKTDNEYLFNLQKKYYKGDTKALSLIFEKARILAMKLTNKESKKRKLYLDENTVFEKGTDAAVLLVEQILKNNLIIETSFIAYIRLQVLKVLFAQTAAQKLESYCKKMHYNIFNMSEKEKLTIKNEFERKTKCRKDETEE